MKTTPIQIESTLQSSNRISQLQGKYRKVKKANQQKTLIQSIYFFAATALVIFLLFNMNSNHEIKFTIPLFSNLAVETIFDNKNNR